MPISDEVEGRIAAAKATATRVTQRLQSEGKVGATMQDEDVRAFFPDVPLETARHTTNIPSGVELRHYLLFGHIPVFDLEPMAPAEFHKRHRITVDALRALAEQGAVRLNLYVRDPGEWTGADGMSGLVQLSQVNGELVDAYLALRAPEYPHHVERHQVELAARLRRENDVELRRLSQAAGIRDAKALARAVATRWAYL